mmetsp:Transcript_60359/g.159581  ORF Transcript_60359/g.159581 Transcript_60359/m.159581 type:complete len:476 (+) Transcript_60359:933-2360(+)
MRAPRVRIRQHVARALPHLAVAAHDHRVRPCRRHAAAATIARIGRRVAAARGVLQSGVPHLTEYQLQVALAQLVARDDSIAVEVELFKELLEREVVASRRGHGVAAQQVAAQLVAFDGAVAIGVDHGKQLVCLHGGGAAGIDAFDGLAHVSGHLAQDGSERHGDDDAGGEEVGEAVREQAQVLRQLEDDEGELAAPSEQQRDPNGLCTGKAEGEGARGKDNANLGAEESDDAGEEGGPLLQAECEVEVGARRHEEDAEQDALKGLDIRLNLLAVLRPRQQYARRKSTRGRAEPQLVGRRAHADCHEQRGGDKRFRRPRGGDKGEDLPQHDRAGDEHAAKAERRLSDEHAELLRALRARAGDERQDDEERRDGDVLEQQHRKRGRAVRAVGPALLLQHRQHKGRRRERACAGEAEGEHGRREDGPDDGVVEWDEALGEWEDLRAQVEVGGGDRGDRQQELREPELEEASELLQPVG